MSWMKQDPAKAPPVAPHVDLMRLHALAQAIAALAPPEVPNPLPPDIATLIELSPALQVDKWGQPLPLAQSEQFRLNRVAAVIADPYDRTRALLLSGELAPDEVDAVRKGRPAVYALLSQEATRELMATPPPILPWADVALGTLFQRPAPEVYAEKQQPQQQGGQSMGRKPPSTVAERREIGIRERR